MSGSVKTPEAGALRGLAGNHVHLPGDEAYDRARQGWNLAVDQRPAAVAEPRDASDVSALVRAARAAGLRVAAQTTGHNCGTLAGDALEDAVLVRTGAMDRVRIDADTGTCRAEGGALWSSAIGVAAARGRAVMHGSAPDVGIAGYCLGGGLSWYARSRGLACNAVTAIEIVLGDGSLVRADAGHEPELFWALRGGGGNFGVVTAVEFTTQPLPSVRAGMLVWDAAYAEEVLRTWAAWTCDTPPSVTTAFRVVHLPPFPDVPEPFRGRSLAIIDGAIADSDEVAALLLAPLRRLAPEVDTFARVAPDALATMHMDPPHPSPNVSGSALLNGFPDAASAAFVAETRAGSGPLLLAELRQLGGALAQPAGGAGAMSHLPGRFAMFCVAVTPTVEAAHAGRAGVRALTSALAPYASQRRYGNLCEDTAPPEAIWDEADLARLRAVRDRVDPTQMFRANHPLG